MIAKQKHTQTNSELIEYSRVFVSANQTDELAYLSNRNCFYEFFFIPCCFKMFMILLSFLYFSGSFIFVFFGFFTVERKTESLKRKATLLFTVPLLFANNQRLNGSFDNKS